MESLYANPKLSQSTEGVSPRRRTTSLGCSLDDPPDDNISLTYAPARSVPHSTVTPRLVCDSCASVNEVLFAG